MNKDDRFSDYIEYISLGAEIAAVIAVPVFLGYGLDLYFETAPWILLVGCLVGMVNFFILIFNLSERFNK